MFVERARVCLYQLLEGGLVQVALQGEVAEGFPRRLIGLHLHRVPLHRVVVADGTSCHQRSPRQALQVLQATEELDLVISNWALS